MRTPFTARRIAPHLTRRELLTAGLAASATFALRPLARPSLLWGGDTGQPKRGGILRVRGFDPPNFDHQLTSTGLTQSTVSFVYSKLVRHKVGADVQPGTFIVEPDLAERWETPDETTYIFHLRKGVKWHNKPPVNGRELTVVGRSFESASSRELARVRRTSPFCRSNLLSLDFRPLMSSTNRMALSNVVSPPPPRLNTSPAPG